VDSRLGSELKEISQLPPLKAAVAEWRAAGERVALVPTMGNLHAGHMALVAEAQRQVDRVVVSLFVNPLQFGPDEDLAAYPRTPREDEAKLRAANVDLLFRPGVEMMYPHGEARAKIHVGELENILCGASRPGHFAGVATVVAKLFNMVAPDMAVFGGKDYQQLIVIRQMVEALAFPIEIVGARTVREADGLALSSRNRYLTRDERDRAPELNRILAGTAERVRAGRRDFAALESAAKAELEAAGFKPDYISIREAQSLGAPGPKTEGLIVLGAAWLGRTRLIDNAFV
jgi:pantoate--beta-alanine ligase